MTIKSRFEGMSVLYVSDNDAVIAILPTSEKLFFSVGTSETDALWNLLKDEAFTNKERNEILQNHVNMTIVGV